MKSTKMMETANTMNTTNTTNTTDTTNKMDTTAGAETENMNTRTESPNSEQQFADKLKSALDQSSIRVIACDIDGTLLHGNETELSPEVVSLIRKLTGKGILFCAASGRQFNSMQKLFCDVRSEIGYICENGAFILMPKPLLKKLSLLPSAVPQESSMIDTMTVLHKTVYDRSTALSVSKDILSITQCELMVSGKNTSYLCPGAAPFLTLVRDVLGNNAAVVSSPDEIEEEILKVSAFCPQGAVPVYQALSPAWKDSMQVAIAGEKWVDFTISHKGSGLRQLSESLSVPPGEILAIGDNFNDVSMLDYAGFPVIMKNAVPELRSAYPLQCEKVEDVLRLL